MWASQSGGEVRFLVIGYADGTCFTAGFDGLHPFPCGLEVCIGAFVIGSVDQVPVFAGSMSALDACVQNLYELGSREELPTNPHSLDLVSSS